ncbi:hypothetical protein FF38_07932 [Lucilia cuprina]|uniref:Sodium channel protein Nach n=1 Tax=Lucilia cuprina TaxID=7375 RepID=A0A0L0BSP1_LUCCU|nr:hypothetical protein FF38_07932 [Lucilia cuprina]
MSFSFIHKRKIQIALRFIVDFLKHNPIHCTSYLAKTQIHWLELMFWILALFIFLIIGLICGMDLVADYVSRNTALTTNVVNAATRTFYPSLTLCPHDILDEKKLKVFKREYAKKLLKMQYFPNPYKFLKEIWKLEEFLQQLSKTTARTAYSYASVSTIPQEDYMQLIFNLSRNYDVRVEGKTAVKIMTEIGICYTINNFLSKQLYTKYWQDLEPYPKMYSDRFTQNPFTFYSSFPLRTNINHNITGKITVYAHNPFEVPTIWTRPALIINNHNKPYILKAAIQQITFDETAFKKKFNEFTFFQNINESQLSAPFSSSRNLCVMECRAHYIRKLCNCLPHFYAHAYWRDSNVCNIQGLNCFYQYIKIIRTINTNTISPTFRCDHCQPNHIEQIVVVKSYNEKISENSTTNLIFQIEHPPIESYTRIIMYNKFDYFHYLVPCHHSLDSQYMVYSLLYYSSYYTSQSGFIRNITGTLVHGKTETSVTTAVTSSGGVMS